MGWPDDTIAKFLTTAEKCMFKYMLDAHTQGNDRKAVIAAIAAMAIVVLILWLFVVLLRP